MPGPVELLVVIGLGVTVVLPAFLVVLNRVRERRARRAARAQGRRR